MNQYVNLGYESLSRRKDLKCGKRTFREYDLAMKILSKKLKLERDKLRETKYAFSESMQENFSTDVQYDSQVGHESSNLQYNTGGENHLSLDDFFKRPVLVHNFSIPISGLANQIISLYQLWTDDVSVRRKLANYSMFRGDMNVRIVVASSAFHYGNLMVSWQPLSNINPIFTALSQYPTNKNYLNYLSQSPQRAVLKIGTDTKLEMKIPFFYPNKFISLPNSTGSFPEFANLGVLAIEGINPLLSASADFLTNVTVSVYCWFDKVELGPTTAATFESSFEDIRNNVNNNKTLNSVANVLPYKDEFADGGPLSKIASAVSNVTDKLSAVPAIGTLAKATSLAVGKAAQWFKSLGFSKPNNLDPILSTRISYVHNFSATTDLHPAYKMSMDPKQELTISNLDGSDEDHLAIKHLSSRESYFHTFTWDTTVAPLSTVLGIFPASPVIYSIEQAGPAPFVVEPTALCFAASGFQVWRGTIKFRFEIVASKFHRGKLLIAYEPNAGGGVSIPNPIPLNQQFMRIVDIEEDRDITIDVGFMSSSAFLPMQAAGEIDSSPILQDYITPSKYVNSGPYLYAAVLNELTAANDLPAYVNVYVSSDDLEVAQPAGLNTIAQNIQFESSFEDMRAYSSGHNSKSTGAYCTINGKTSPLTNEYLQFYGERILSYRQLLKRDIIRYKEFNGASIRMSLSVLGLYCSNMFPKVNGTLAIPNQNTLTSTSLLTSLFDHLRYGYVAMRGGVRYTFEPVGLARVMGTVTARSDVLTESQYISTVAAIDDVFPVDQIGGMIVPAARSSGLATFEIPFYSNTLFVPAFLPYIPSASLIYPQPLTNMYTLMSKTEGTETVAGNRIYCSVGEDFTFQHFQGSPFIVTDVN